MGECGCGETNPHVTLEAPGENTYGIQVYTGCSYCHTPIAIDVYRFGPEFTEDFFDGAEPLTIQPYDGGGDATDGVGTLILIDPDRVPDLIDKMLADDIIEDAQLTDMRPDEWRRLIGYLIEPRDPSADIQGGDDA